MARQKQAPDRPASDQQDVQAAQEIHDLPNRDAMSILTGLPTIPGLPTGLLGDQTLPPATGTPAPTDPAGPLPPEAAQPGDLNTVAPSNQVSQTNIDSDGTTQTTGATQDVPIVQTTS